MLNINGSLGEGGGQILRTSVALSAVTQKAVKITNIRANRPNPGLQAQHLNAVKAVAELCDADVSGLKIGSKEIEFRPKKISGGNFSIDIGTAGSTTLVLQSLMIPAFHSEEKLKIKITGGTDVRWSPPVDYLNFVTLSLLKKFGYDAELELLKRGYYPKGGGEVLVIIKPSRLEKIELTERGEILNTMGISHAHSDLKKSEVAERQSKSARFLFFNKLKKEVKMKNEYSDTLSYGSGITLWAETENSILGADSLGEKGKRAETVGDEAARNLIDALNTNAALDKHMADQIVPYLALAGGSVSVSEITQHTKTNVEIVNKFGFNLEVKGNIISSKC